MVDNRRFEYRKYAGIINGCSDSYTEVPIDNLIEKFTAQETKLNKIRVMAVFNIIIALIFFILMLYKACKLFDYLYAKVINKIGKTKVDDENSKPGRVESVGKRETGRKR